MKKDEIKIGETYRVKVTGKLADVRITGENPHGGWAGVNVATNRKVHIKSAQRLRGKSPARPGGKHIMTKAEYEAEAADVGPKSKKPAKAAKDAKPAAKRHTGERAAKGAKRPSGLAAAATVLAEAGTPLNTKEMVDRMIAKGLWKTSGQTPSATIYAAIIREIAAKGGESRFRKTERGKFELAK